MSVWNKGILLKLDKKKEDSNQNSIEKTKTMILSWQMCRLHCKMAQSEF